MFRGHDLRSGYKPSNRARRGCSSGRRNIKPNAPAIPSTHSKEARVGFHLSPNLRNLRKSLEARVGIERFLLCLRGENDLFAERIKLSLALLSLSRLISLTEEFTERDMRSLKQLFVMKPP